MQTKKEEQLIKIARGAIETKKISSTDFNEKAGVFVTLRTYPKKELRGCIGYAEAVYPLGEGLQRAAIAAAYSDPRFPPIAKSELDKIIVEVSILSEPKETPLSDIRLGYGVILESGRHKALFLPQVWAQLPDKKDFLDELCMKAGLSLGSWATEGIKFFKFHVDAFEEKSPNGKISKNY